MLLGLAIVAVMTLLRSPGTWIDRGRRFAAGAVAAVTMASLTAPHWLVFLERAESVDCPSLRQAVRHSLQESRTQSLWP